MEQTLRSNLFAVAELYASANSMTLHNVAAVAARDYGFFSRLRRSEKAFTVRKYDQVMQWFSDHWPVRVEWPKGVERPAPTRAVA